MFEFNHLSYEKADVNTNNNKSQGQLKIPRREFTQIHIKII